MWLEAGKAQHGCIQLCSLSFCFPSWTPTSISCQGWANRWGGLRSGVAQLLWSSCLLLYLNIWMPWMVNVCFMHMQKGHGSCLKKMDLVNLATIIQEVCGRAANKIQTFCLLGLCLHNNSILPLLICACCLIRTCCSVCFLKGKEHWESHALILYRKSQQLHRKTQ